MSFSLLFHEYSYLYLSPHRHAIYSAFLVYSVSLATHSVLLTPHSWFIHRVSCYVFSSHPQAQCDRTSQTRNHKSWRGLRCPTPKLSGEDLLGVERRLLAGR
ncbi:hypothetical protein BDW74DRAFT_136905 [Aspergillus multicolor]|uniref:uncharacterized protein n=1 Tax=Aspergillus multicolor TaxID=41759 RepID=UPI003CCDD924